MQQHRAHVGRGLADFDLCERLRESPLVFCTLWTANHLLKAKRVPSKKNDGSHVAREDHGL
jgi:hypothetical protein